MKKIKILHIADLHFRHGGRLFYSSGKKINNGLILNGHNVLNISDRDVTSQRKSIFDIGSKKYLFNQIKKNIENFKPDLILFGHVDRLDYENFFPFNSFVVDGIGMSISGFSRSGSGEICWCLI